MLSAKFTSRELRALVDTVVERQVPKDTAIMDLFEAKAIGTVERTQRNVGCFLEKSGQRLQA